jgi:predicted  nucleic acid-binding Zn-ribbon protein
MNELITNVWKLQSLELDEATAGRPKEIAALRGKIPPQVLGHYDRLRARGKKGVALVRNQVCSACHMQVPLGAILTLMRGEDIQLCACCGRYLYLPESTGAPIPAAPKRSHKKPAEREALLPVA